MRHLRLLLAGVVLALTPSLARAQLEHEVKAAYLFKFLSYVEWPPAALGAEGAPIVIAVLGAEDVRSALQDIVAGRTAQGRPVEVHALKAGDPATGVHVLFVGRAAAAELPKIANRSGVLVVGESEGAIDEGAMITLLRVGNRVRFDVAPEAAERVGLHISSRMLTVAHHVKSGKP